VVAGGIFVGLGVVAAFQGAAGPPNKVKGAALGFSTSGRTPCNARVPSLRAVARGKVRSDLRLLELSTRDHLSADGIDRLVHAITEARETATSSASKISPPRDVRVARRLQRRKRPDGPRRSRSRLAGARRRGRGQATFLAARRCSAGAPAACSWSTIGGGSLELAIRRDEEPDAVASLPLGAGRLTRPGTAGPATAAELDRLRAQVRAYLADAVAEFSASDEADIAVAPRKTLRALARSGRGAVQRRRCPAGADPQEATTSVRAAREHVREETQRLPGVSIGRPSR